MMFTAKIIDSKRVKDNAEMIVEFTNGEETFTKDYKYPRLEDIDNTFNKTVKSEIDRVNDLEKNLKPMETLQQALDNYLT